MEVKRVIGGPELFSVKFGVTINTGPEARIESQCLVMACIYLTPEPATFLR